MYETFEHTADLGLRIRAPDLNRLFGEAAEALFSAIVVNPQAIEPVQEIRFSVTADRADDLLHDWLAELLFTFDSRRLLLSQFDVQVNNTSADEYIRLAATACATARGEVFDPQRHELRMEIKAITYHGLKVEQTPDGWLAEVIVDI